MSDIPLPPVEIIHRALMVLAGVCDYAQRPDGIGFNAFDTAFGHELALQDHLTTGQALIALKMLRKYQKQLAEYHITLPDTVEVHTAPIATVKDGRIYLTFGGKPDEDTRTFVKSIGGRWHPDLKDTPWSVVHSKGNITAIFTRWGITGLAEPVEQAASAPVVQPQAQPRSEVAFTVKNGSILVTFPVFSRSNVDLVKTLPERKWLPDEPGKPWSVPSRLANKLVEMFPNAQGIESLTELAKHQQELSQLSGKADGAKIALKGLTGELYPFQAVGVEFIEKANGRALIGDEPGLGKTIQAIAYLAQHPELRPAVIVVPASLKLNWRNEINKWLSKPERVAVISGTKTYDLTITGAGIIIINYDILNAWIDQVIAFKPAVVIGDESHYCKNPKVLRSKAMKEISKKISKIVLLTGTPITNRPVELFPLLNMVNPHDWPNFFKFATRYCDAKQNGFGWDFTGASNLEELHEAIKPYMIRRRKSQVLTELPPKVWSNLVVDFDEKMRREYQAEVARAEEEVESMANAQQLAMIEKLKQLAVKAKLPGIIDWITDFLETGEKLIVFATHHSTIHALEEAFPGISVTITGETPVNKRQDVVQRFQEDSSIKLFFGNIQAAGIGITLTAASNVLFVEWPWTPGEISQASDRAHRIGQRDSVTIYLSIAEGTIDQDIADLLESKRQVIDMVHDGAVGEDMQFGILDELVKRIISRKSPPKD